MQTGLLTPPGFDGGRCIARMGKSIRKLAALFTKGNQWGLTELPCVVCSSGGFDLSVWGSRSEGLRAFSQRRSMGIVRVVLCGHSV
jgi:hypothetical protein